MAQQPNPASRQPWQFSLEQLFLAVMLAGVACAAAKCFVAVIGWGGFFRVLGLFLIPVLLCGGIGVWRGRLLFWLSYGIALDLLILGFALLLRH